MPNSTPTYINFTFFLRKRWLLPAGYLALAPLVAQAQNRAAVSGTVANAADIPQEYVTITLHRAADSVVVKTEFTDPKGAFQLSAAAGGRYLVSASQVGFGRYWSPPFELPATGLALPAIRLAASGATTLHDVNVTGRQPLYERRADRTVVNVAESPLAAGATTLDVLGRAPGVTVGASDQLALRGRQGLLVLLDGKRVPLTGQELADYLRALPAEQIQSIDLVTSPSARYEAQGGAGVIEIKLKKDQRLGTNGSLNASYGRGRYGNFVGGGSLNHRRKNVNLYGTYALNARQYYTQFNFERQFGATSTEQYTYQYLQQRTHSAKVGLDLNLSKRTLLSVSATGLASQTNNATTGEALFYDKNRALSDHLSSRAAQDINRPSGSVSLNLRHAFADSAAARSLSADIDYAHYRTTRLLRLDAYRDAPFAADFTELTGDQRNDLRIGTAKVDYSQPLPRRARLEAGAKVTQIVSDNDIAFVRRTGLTPADYLYTPLTAISQPFRYRENVNAAYVSLRGGTARTTVQAGLRGEQTIIGAELAGATVREQNYFQLFPNLLVQHKLGPSHALALTAARRIDRPSYAQVNPLRAYLEATSYTAGNLFLTAQTSYNFEVAHTYKGKFTTALAYAHTSHPIVRAQQPSLDGGLVVVSQPVNLTTENFYTLILTAPLDLAKWWNLYANVQVYYDQYQGTLVGTYLNRGQLSINLTANNSFVLPHGWSAEVNGLYESGNVGGFQVLRPRGQVSAALQKGLWNKQATLRFGITDIFYTAPLRITSAYDSFSETFRNNQDSRIATVAFTYRFGNSKVAAARRRAAGADEELRRATGQ